VRDELRTAHVPTPPFAPFHARVPMPDPRPCLGSEGTRGCDGGGPRERGSAAGEAGAPYEARPTT
jgi:hypothetical protein